MKYLFYILFVIFTFQPVWAQKIIEKDFKPSFAKFGVDGCFVLFNQSDNEFIKYNPALCDSGFIPASTFKIPNSLIVLEEGIITDTSEIIKWDGHPWPVVKWNQDQTLRTAMKYSCVWAYVGFAEQVGIDKYHHYIRLFNYGNKDLTGPPARFWLDGFIRISANEQIEFLKKFYNYELPISKRAVDIVKNIIVLEQTENYILSGKTGGGRLNDNEYIMWLVGYVEIDGKPYFYALNFMTNDFGGLSQARYDIAKDILRSLNLIKEPLH